MRAVIEFDMDSGNIAAAIQNTLKEYNVLGDKLHYSAIVAFVHAANHGDAQYLTMFFDGLRTNDQNMLKAWLLKLSTYTDVVAGEEVKKQWIGHRTVEKDAKRPAGFFVKPKTEGVRKDKFQPAELWQGEAFFDTPDKGGKPMTLAMILAALAKLPNQTEKKVEKANEEGESTTPVALSDRVTKAIKELAGFADEELKMLELLANKPAVNTLPAPTAQQ